MRIESINNPKVKEWVKLKEKKYRDVHFEFLIEGDHLMREALSQGIIKEIIATDVSFANPNIPFFEVSENIMKRLSSQVSGTNVICVCKKLEEKEIKGNVCLLDCIQDPGNLGTIIRSAVAFSFDTIILSPDTVDLYNEKVIRASEGMLFHLNFIKKDLKLMIKELKQKGYNIYGTDVKIGKNLKEISFSSQNAIIIGNEGKGMRDDLKELCDFLVHIPINRACESLNAGVAASVIFYEMGGF